MKSVLMVLAWGVLAFIPAKSFAFPSPSSVWVHPNQVSVTVFNIFNAPISCLGQVQGLRNDGLVQYASFSMTMIPPGLSEYFYIYSYLPGIFFVNGFAGVDCWFGF